ncbi:MAG: hypothetical protein ABI907_01435 [Ramlibacter sp.]
MNGELEPPDPGNAAVEEVVRQGPSGTVAVVGVATFLVLAMYFLFYFFAYLPRGAVQ